MNLSISPIPDEFKRKLIDSYQLVTKQLDEECDTAQLEQVWRIAIREEEDVIGHLRGLDVDVNTYLDSGTTPLHVLSAHGMCNDSTKIVVRSV